MAEHTKIGWVNHSFAPWFGCTQVAPECDLCYAKDWARRFRKAEWGPHAPRQRAAASTWKLPLRWQRQAVAAGEHHRVFCSHYSDVFDRQAPEPWRGDVWALIRQCPDLQWLLLTKRAQNIRKMLPDGWPWPNVWLGVTAGKQRSWARDVRVLRTIPATVRFVSVEPMLAPITADLAGIDWVICGGESGHGFRPFDPDWARALHDQCRATGTAFFMKQLGGHPDKRDKLDQLPLDLRIRQWPTLAA